MRAILISTIVLVFLLSLPVIGLTAQHGHIPALRMQPSAVMQQGPASFVANYSIPVPKNSQPDAIVPGPNRTLWFTEFHPGSLGEFNSTSKAFANYTVPENGALPVTLAFDGPNHIWFTDQDPNSPSVWMMNITGKPTFHQFLTNAANSSPVFILVDHSNGNVWFTDTTGNYLGEIDHSTLRMTEFRSPSDSAGPVEIALQNGTSYLWATERAGKIARFDMQTGTFQEFNPSVPLSYPVGIVLDKQGNVWVSEHGGSAVVEFTPSSSTWKKYPTSQWTTAPGSGPATLTIDSLGRLWFAEHYADRIGRLDPTTGSMEEFAIPLPGAYSLLNSMDATGDYWFAMAYAGSIGMIPGSASSAIKITPVASPTPSVESGQTLSSQFIITNDLSTSITLTLGVTSFFTTNYYTTSSEVSIPTSSLTLGPGENKTITGMVTPDFSLSSGIYTAGLVASYGSVASIGVFFLQVNTSPWYQLETLLPEILVSIAAVVVVAFLLIRRKKRTGPPPQAKPVPKISLIVSLAILLLSLVQQTGQSWAKCPGLPPPPVNPGNGVDYYGIALDIGSIAFFGIVAYFLIRSWLRGRSAK